MQTGIARTADGLLLPSQGGGPMFQAFVEVALSSFKRSPIVVRTATTLCPVLSSSNQLHLRSLRQCGRRLALGA